MRKILAVWAALSATAFLGAAGPSWAETWPAKPVRLMIGAAAGSAPDVIARILTDRLAPEWGQQIVIDNRPGAAGNVGAQAAARAAPDGYTLLFGQAATIAINQHTFKSMPFDPERDFAPVVGIGISPMMIVVHPSLPIRTVAELVDVAKANPGGLDFAASGARNIPHFTGMLFNLLTGASLVHVPYRGSAQAMQDVQAGQLKVMIDGVPSLRQHIASGAVRAIAVTSPRRLPGFEAVPAVAETLPGFSTVGWFAILAPTGTPAEAVARVNRDFNRLLAEPEMKRRLEEFGIFDGGGAPEQLAAFIAGERKAWGEFVRRAKIEPE